MQPSYPNYPRYSAPRQPYRQPTRPRRAPAPKMARAQNVSRPPRRERVAPAPTAPKVARAQSTERPRAPREELAPLVMPSPEQLGIHLKPKLPDPPAPSGDWLSMVRRLEELGMSDFQFKPHPRGFQFVFVMADDRQFNVVGADKIDVLQQALAQAEQSTFSQ